MTDVVRVQRQLLSRSTHASDRVLCQCRPEEAKAMATDRIVRRVLVNHNSSITVNIVSTFREYVIDFLAFDVIPANMLSGPCIHPSRFHAGSIMGTPEQLSVLSCVRPCALSFYRCEIIPPNQIGSHLQIQRRHTTVDG